MTYDVVALTHEPPDARTLLDALRAEGSGLEVDAPEHGNVLQVLDEDGAPLLAVEASIPIRVEGEAQRLLGPFAAGLPAPVWWTEVRAAERPAAVELADAFADALIERLGGRRWSSERPE
ncbi:hypothetical protein [Actinomadura violacea]|uniref:Uncharacterized protein n=1 Tax=Actinomadura violacea TaxID=2819934 RepID=A0ABS3S8D3_9ACTN|nr:hypothetical protein [Actinomadura violacea]MBO2465253.1 hypothetical protein [Actinomadura violacea]